MILTLTLNPSIDISYSLDRINLDTVNRVNKTIKTAGGKGLNVTRVLSEYGEDVEASGFLGGKLGEFIEQQLNNAQIKHNFLRLKKKRVIVLLFSMKDNKRRSLSRVLQLPRMKLRNLKHI